MRFRSPICSGLIVLSLMSSSALAAEKLERTRYWGGLDIAAGKVQRSVAGVEEDETKFFLGFKVGYTLNPHFLMGVELSGWLFEATSLWDPSVGEGISQVFLITRYYPSQDSGLFAKVGGGYVSHWNNRPGEPRRKEGWGLTFGGGYDFSLNKNLAITPFVTYSFGEADDQEHNALTLGVGFTLP